MVCILSIFFLFVMFVLWRNGLFVRTNFFSSSKHYINKRFHNLTQPATRYKGSILSLKLWKAMFKIVFASWPRQKSLKKRRVLHERESNLVTYFINHATFLIQVGQYNFLTDPVWSDRVSPFSFAGPKRVKDVGILMQDLPQIDFVLISHDHYDHLDIASIKRLQHMFNPKFFVGLGVDTILRKHGICNIEVMDWWQYKSFGRKDCIHFVPAQHFSGRGLLDRNSTLWGGFVVECAEKTFYFAGDTGFQENTFNCIKNKFGSIDLAFLPIGAYKPKEFMSPVHMSPNEAVLAHKILLSKKTIAMHYGTFCLSTEEYHEPVQDLKLAKQKHGEEDNVLVLDHGEYFSF
ncbi:MBL fold metallo-hydrolase [Candidatus Sneabacter namystus]|uniref:Metallo-beta-lactamase domain-containing protein n=1 Tax=Candidatus Sneabacter namystus TaxID=2601646 RepID=A0A5C0UI10_9RICK|nr:MBL fold metallo-hydrolase [Candidatus Sneabacter namystus]QEK39389.1 hypothetical protein FZC37_00310 [Candidatus Sneabacter namystus]